MQNKTENFNGKPVASTLDRSKVWPDLAGQMAGQTVGQMSRPLYSGCLGCLAFGGEGRSQYQTPFLRVGIASIQNSTLAKILIATMFLPLLGSHATETLAAGMGENRLGASSLGAISNPANLTAALSPVFLPELSSKGEDTENCIWVGDCD
ncbi:MAG: hypothetical protein F6J93_07510 [Oscillatoria sp. SIO1A7]|nr:hypothetical protein [Oscillatoria sp. SIO1A7]